MSLVAAPVIGEPVQCHHIGEIAGANTDPPAIPVEKTYIITARLWQEDVPHMRVAVKDGHIAVRVVALIQTMSALDQALVDVPALRRQAVADTIGEPLKLLRENLDLRVVRLQPATDRDAKARIVPPLGMKARPRGYDPLSLFSGRRQWPQRERKMCTGQIFQQQVPVIRVFAPDGVKAPRDQTRRHSCSNLPVKRDLLPTRVPTRTRALRQPGLQDERRRRFLRGTLI